VRVGKSKAPRTDGSSSSITYYSHVKEDLQASCQDVAVKTVSKSGRVADVGLIRNEIQVMALILEKVPHPNIIKLLDVFDAEDAVHIVLELCRGGELFDRIISRGRYSEMHAAYIIRQIASGLKALHAAGVMHRDLKPENVLFVTAEGEELKIMDFGLSLIDGTDDAMHGLFGSLDYVAPEILSNRRFHLRGDMWSLGVIMYILLCGYPPFHQQEVRLKQECILMARFDFNDPLWDHVSAEAKDAICRLLVLDPEQRISAATLLEHPWVMEGGVASTRDMPITFFEKLGVFNARRKFKAAVLTAIAASPRRLRPSLTKLLGDTTLTREELEALHVQFLKVTKGGTRMSAGWSATQLTLEQFEDVLEAVNIEFEASISVRMFEIFDKNGDGMIDFRELVCGLSVLRQNEGEDALHFCFRVYDVDNSGTITRDELAAMLGAISFGETEMDMEKLALVEDIFTTMDLNNDGHISFDEFKASIAANPLLVQLILNPFQAVGTSQPMDTMEEC